MFSNKSLLKKRTPENGIDRENFLSLLVDEYLNSTSHGELWPISANTLILIIILLRNVLQNRILISICTLKPIIGLSSSI